MGLSDQVIDRIKGMILSGEFPPGARLPTEGELALQWGVSRNSLREAVCALSAMQILVIRQGSGTYVTGLEPHRLMKNLSFLSDISHGDSALHLLQIRRLIEPELTAMAARRASDADLTRLQEVLDDGLAIDGIEEYIRTDIRFHRAVAELAGNPVLTGLLEMLSTQTQRVRILRGTESAQAIDRARREHAVILEALRRRDDRLAAATALVHIGALESWLRDATA